MCTCEETLRAINLTSAVRVLYPHRWTGLYSRLGSWYSDVLRNAILSCAISRFTHLHIRWVLGSTAYGQAYFKLSTLAARIIGKWRGEGPFWLMTSRL